MTIDMTTPQGRVAQQYMNHKGLGGWKPVEVDKIEGTPCWYFVYELPEGDLELEVYWEQDEWKVNVSTFTLVP